jgi:peroxiredoxin
MSGRLKAGDPAPDFSCTTPWSSISSFFSEERNKNVILIFLRYIGCPICQVEMSNIKRNLYLLDDKSTSVSVVLQSSPENVASISDRNDWPFKILCDPDSVIFKLYFVEPGGIFKYLHPSGLIATGKSFLMGKKHGKFEGIETQLPASFVISSSGLIKYAHYGKRINDVPSLQILIKYA